MERVEEAIYSLRKGEIIIIYDGEERENEADLVIAAEFITPKIIAKFRKEGGGLICLAVHPKIAERLNLPFMTDILRSLKFPLNKLVISKTPYGDKPAFSISINHKKTFTGITDIDRARTIKEFVKLGKEQNRRKAREKFIKNFYSPGHVPLLVGAKGLLKERRGQTELSLTLCELAGLTPLSVICELLDEKTGRALKKEKTIKYAEMNHMVFLEGNDVMRLEDG